MQKLTNKRLRGFTLIELMIVVVIIGILASLAIYGVQKYVASSKTGEARNMLGAISKGAVTAFEGETMAGTLLETGGSVGSSRRLCLTAPNTVPAAITSVKGTKYQSSEAEWSTDPALPNAAITGWTCLKFSISGPQYYMYGYTAVSPVPIDNTGAFTATATGDLDGDGTTSEFTRQGQIVGNAPDFTLTLSPTATELRPDE